MRRELILILLILFVLTTLAVSGCSTTGNNASVTPTQQYPEISTATQTSQNVIEPTAISIVSESAGNGKLSRVSQLINADNLHGYMYRVTESTYGMNKTFEISISYSNVTYKDVDAKLTTITQYTSASNGTYIAGTPTGVYTSKTNGNVLGGVNKVVINGQPMDQDMSINEATNILLDDIVNNALTNGGIALTYIGPETITVDDKTYDCIRYSVPMGKNTTEIEWYTPHSPMPVKSLWEPNGNYSQMTELLSWY